MKCIFIGSTAARHWFPDWREPRDLDMLCSTPFKLKGVDAQCHELAEYIIDRSADPAFADPIILYTLKVSHAYWDIHWDKTMYDIWQFQQRGWAILDQDLHDRLVQLWTKIHGPKKVNLGQSKDTFWHDAVKRRYNHEWLHERVKFYGRALHENLHPDHSDVLIDHQKFLNLSEFHQLQLAMEEVLTIAIERADLGIQSSKSDRLRAVKYAHKKLCTSMAKGWFAQFCVENAHLLVGDRSYWFDHFNAVINNLPREQP